MSAPDYSFRPVTPADTPFLAEVYRTSRWAELEPTGWTDEQKRSFLRAQFDAQSADWARTLPNAKREIILVRGAPAGRLYTDARPSQRDLRIADIALLPPFRRQGIGSRIIAQLIAEADGNAWKISLHVEPRNPAQLLYSRLGFVPVQTAGAYLYMERPCGASA